MTITIDEIQNQISDLQKLLDTMKNPALEISRNFTGQYFKLYKEKQYRRMESDGVAIWECFIETKKDWYLLDKMEIKKLEELYIKDCVPTIVKTEKIEEFEEVEMIDIS